MLPFVRASFQLANLSQHVAHTHPSGTGGRSDVSGAAGSLYLPRRFSWASQRARRSTRMRSSRTSAGSYSRPSARASSASVGANSPEQAARSDAGPVAFQVRLRPPQRRHRRIQPRELRLNLRNNAVLLGEGGDGYRDRSEFLGVNILQRDPG